ncbi:hypothetical protein K3495_g3844 [Podosphaera aphanis]|nr:hypothetical protein K3495_g3844 [Podosphaera aphanis]
MEKSTKIWYPWWNYECRFAAHSYRRARREGPATWKKFELQKSVRQAKKAYWNSMIAKTKSLPEAYKVVCWHNAAWRFHSPPLRHEEGSEVILDPQKKAKLLHRALLCRHLEAEEIPPETPAVPQRNIPWQLISNGEVFKVTCQFTSTSPGEDELTTTCLRLAWPVLGDRITNLFNYCIQLGIHPHAFKSVAIVILPKPGQRDRSILKSHRPKALLSCQGKGLERLIARHIS